MECNDRLVEWIRNLYGPGRIFPSARSLSLAAGYSPAAVSACEQQGHATSDMLINIARAASCSPLEALIVGGYLHPAEMSGVGDLSREESQIIERLRNVTDELKAGLVAGIAAAATLSNNAVAYAEDVADGVLDDDASRSRWSFVGHAVKTALVVGTTINVWTTFGFGPLIPKIIEWVASAKAYLMGLL